MPGRPLIWTIVGQGPTTLAVDAGGVVWTFLLSSIFSELLSQRAVKLKPTHQPTSFYLYFRGAPVAQWVKRWPTDLAEFNPHSRRNLLIRKRSSIAHSLSLSSKHRPDITEILLKRT